MIYAVVYDYDLAGVMNGEGRGWIMSHNYHIFAYFSIKSYHKLPEA